LIAQRFKRIVAKVGLDREREPLDLTQFKKPLRPRTDGQQDMFG
jgi:hypothetical protein